MQFLGIELARATRPPALLATRALLGSQQTNCPSDGRLKNMGRNMAIARHLPGHLKLQTRRGRRSRTQATSAQNPWALRWLSSAWLAELFRRPTHLPACLRVPVFPASAWCAAAAGACFLRRPLPTISFPPPNRPKRTIPPLPRHVAAGLAMSRPRRVQELRRPLYSATMLRRRHLPSRSR